MQIVGVNQCRSDQKILIRTTNKAVLVILSLVNDNFHEKFLKYKDVDLLKKNNCEVKGCL